MDIVNRLLAFMEAHGIGSTQFADSCGIPRPSLSQLLSGRNKKISDAVISKIHAAYPSLSILWLLFGEGQMEVSANIGFSEPQNGGKTALQSLSTNGLGGSQIDLSDDDGGLFGSTNMQDPLIFDDDERNDTDIDNSSADGITSADTGSVVTIPADGSKSIVNIMVFYSDNSFQSFVPR